MSDSSARAPRLKKYAINGAIAAVYIGIPVFAVLALYPVMAGWREGARELQDAEANLGGWLKTMSALVPGRTHVEKEQAYTAAMAAECVRARNYYQSRDRLLERTILESHSGDPILVKLKFANLRTDLAKKGNCSDPKGLLPQYPWEKSGEDTPRREDFKSIEKRACVADVLIGVLASAGQPFAVQHVTVGDSMQPPEKAAVADFAATDEGAASNGAKLGYVSWPVVLNFTAPFGNVGVLLERLVTPPGQCPPILIHSLRLAGLDGGRVAVTVGLSVLDFD